MPVPPNVTGYTSLTQQVRLCLEQSPGEQLLMPETAAAATMSLTTQPNVASPTTGMHLHFYVIGNTAAGTIVIAGTNPAGGAVTSQTYHIPIAPQNAQGYTEFTTIEVFATVNASGITTTGLSASAEIIVFGSPAGKYLIPATFEAEEKIPKFSPPDKRGILFKNLRVSQLAKGAAIDKLDSALYPDSLWLAYMLIGASPVVTTVPASPSSLLAATTKAATMTLTSGPKAPGQFLIFTPASNSATGTITLSGTDQYGNSVSETINVAANNNPVYSTKRYSALTSPGTNQFTTTGLSTGATLAVTGVFAWVYTWTYDGINNLSLYSATFEHFDGVIGKKLPYSILTDGTFDWQKEKDIAVTCKGEAQDYLLVGDPNPSSWPAGSNPFATLAQPTSLPMISWPGTFFLDALPGTPGTTQTGEFLTFKAQIATGQKPFYIGDGMQRWSDVTRASEPDFSIDATVVFQNYQEYLTYFKSNQKFVAVANFQGSLLGSLSGSTYYEYWQWTFPAKFDTYKPDSSKNPVEVTAKIMSEYDFGLGYAYKLAVCCQVPPTYTS